MNWIIRDLEKQDEMEFCNCLESWSDEMAESGDHKAHWLEQMKTEGTIGVKLAITDDGKYAGMIQYYPSLYSPAESSSGDIWFIHCIWVHGYKKGQGNFQGQGIGKALLAAAEKDILSRGGAAILAWGLSLPFWMKSRWYKKNGYHKADKTGIRELVIKSLDGTEHSGSWRKTAKLPPARDANGNLLATTFMSGACTVTAIAYERLKNVASNLPVTMKLIDASKPENLDEWGLADVIFIGRRRIEIGPPPSEAKLSRILRKEIKRIKLSRKSGER